MIRKASQLQRVQERGPVTRLIDETFETNGGIFRLAPAWVGRPGIIIPGRRIKLRDEFMTREVAVNERWFSSVTYADNGAYNSVCPPDHGLSYIVIGDTKVRLKDALDVCGEAIVGKGRVWNVLPKFFDNWHRIPVHLHPCQEHCSEGLTGKPEAYYFPEELNMNRNAHPSTAFGVDPAFSDTQIIDFLKNYMKGDNRLTALGNTIDLIPGTGWYMPACTFHAPGSLVTYELQVASDVTCIPESRVNDMVMPADLVDRDIPVKMERDGADAVYDYILSMVRCKNSGNSDNVRKEYFRPPVTVGTSKEGGQSWVIYRTGKASLPKNSDLFSAKKSVVQPGCEIELEENGAFGAIVLRGSGKIMVGGKEPLPVASVTMFDDRDAVYGDEFFVSASAARKIKVVCDSQEPLHFYQHFASDSNPEAAKLKIPEYRPFPL